MEEKRRSKRIKAHLELNVSSLFKQDNVLVENINAPITVAPPTPRAVINTMLIKVTFLYLLLQSILHRLMYYPLFEKIP